MHKKRKILWISVGCVCAFIVLASLIIHFGFKVKTIDVEFQSRLANTRLDAGIQENVKNYFKTNENIILMEFDEPISKVEKDIPYLKVNQVMKNFPNILRVYISERIPRYKVMDSVDNSIWYILDEDFKVLRVILDTDDKTGTEFDSVIEISNETLSVSGLSAGEFISSNESTMQFMKDIVAGVYGKTEDFSIVKSVKIELDSENEYKFVLVMKNNANPNSVGCTIIASGETELTKKIFAGISTYQAELSATDFINDSSTTITIYYENGTYVGVKSVN